MAFETVTNPSARSDAKFLRVSATGFSANKRLAVAGELLEIQIDFEERVIRCKVSRSGCPVGVGGVVSCRPAARRIKEANPDVARIELTTRSDGWHYGTF